MGSGFKINPRAIENMTRELQREFDKHPIRVPVEGEPRPDSFPAFSGTTVNYNGPVVQVTGDHAQLAWGNNVVNQTQDRIEQIAPGYEDLAKILTTLLAASPQLELADADKEALEQEVGALLSQVTEAEPDAGVLKKGITMVKGLLAPVIAGASTGISAEATELVRSTIEQLGHVLPG